MRRAGDRASVGTPRMNCVADDLHRRPLAGSGSPGQTHGNAVTNPRIRVCSTVVLTALSLTMRNCFIPPCPSYDGTAHVRSMSFDNEHQSSCATIGFRTESSNHTTTRRSLLRGLEQPHRSALAHHVHRIAPMGARVLINGTRYKSYDGCQRDQAPLGNW